MIMFAAVFGLAAWTYLLFFHHGFWKSDQRLPAKTAPLDQWPAVVAIVPARNEAESIGQVAAALRAQNYAGAFRIIVVDDASDDGTADIARAATGKHALQVLTAPPLPAGWIGKLAALNAGLAEAGTPDYVLFTDADVVHPPATLSHLVSKAVNDKRDLVSLMVRLRCESFWERRLIPAFIFFFQMLYPFRAVNSDTSRVAAVAGGCVLLRHDALTRAGGLEAIRGNIIDDCALAGAVKKSGGRLWLGLTDTSHSLRRVDSLGPLWGMVRRTAFTQLRHSWILLLCTVVGLALVFLGPPLAVLTTPWHHTVPATVAGAFAWFFMSLAYAPTLIDYRRGPGAGLALPLIAALYAAMTIDSALAHLVRRGGSWKGRNYGPS